MMPREKLAIGLIFAAGAGYRVIDNQLSHAGWVVKSQGEWLLLGKGWATLAPGWPLVLLGILCGAGLTLIGLASFYECTQGAELRRQVQQARRENFQARSAARKELEGEYRDAMRQTEAARSAALRREAEAIDAIERAQREIAQAAARETEAQEKSRVAEAKMAAAQGGFERVKRRKAKNTGNRDGGNLNPSKGF